MAQSAYRFMADSFRATMGPEGAGLRHERLLTWRRETTVTRLEHPTRLDRARAIGYRAKPGFIVVRVRVRRGGQRHRAIIAGRRPKRKGILRMVIAKSLQRIAEERAQKHYPNLEVLNSYWVGEDGTQKFYEVILLDPAQPAIQADRREGWIGAHRGRAYRGLTRAGRDGRGLRWKGKGAERMRPSRQRNRREERRTQSKVIP